MASASQMSGGRIAILVHSMNEGGAQQRLISLANRFAERGNEVDLVAVRDQGRAGRLLSNQVRQIALDAHGKRSWIKELDGLGALKAYLSEQRPSVLMAGSNRVHIVAACAVSRMAQKPLLVLRAARHPLRHKSWWKPWKRLRERCLRMCERWAYRRANLIIAVSSESADAIRALVPDPAKVVVIRNPTITERFRASLQIRADHRWFDEAEHGGDRVVVGVGRLSPQKDFGTLVKAVAIANRRRPLKLILLGEGKRRTALEALVARLGLGQRADLLGHVEGVGGWLRRADLLVSSSLWEGSPGVIIEAFAAGCPVVATACPGGSVELLRSRVGGMLVPMRDPAAMAEAILEVLDGRRDDSALEALAAPFEDNGRADSDYLRAIEAAVAHRNRSSSSSNVCTQIKTVGLC